MSYARATAASFMRTASSSLTSTTSRNTVPSSLKKVVVVNSAVVATKVSVVQTRASENERRQVDRANANKLSLEITERLAALRAARLKRKEDARKNVPGSRKVRVVPGPKREKLVCPEETRWTAIPSHRTAFPVKSGLKKVKIGQAVSRSGSVEVVRRSRSLTRSGLAFCFCSFRRSTEP
jgi:tRNA threonylcarbamoyladenosine modification (KEOPS) complex Cgi121 subunit